MIRIAVVDSGVTAGHPHLAGVKLAGFAVDPQTGEADTDYSDRHGHGTAVAANLARVAPSVELFAVQVLDNRLRCSHEHLARALELLADHKPDVVNLSVGTVLKAAAPALEEAVARLQALGAVVVTAADPWGRPAWPAESLDVFVARPRADLQAGQVEPDSKNGPLAFFAHGEARSPRDDGQAAPGNFAGSSLACSTLSGRIGLLLQAGEIAGGRAGIKKLSRILSHGVQGE